MVMAAAFKALFHRLSGQQDLALGNLTANRGHGTESLIGIFANIVVLRSTVDADSSFADVLDATARQVLAAHDHPLPFELVLTHLVDSRDPSYMPYAQVVLARPVDALCVHSTQCRHRRRGVQRHGLRRCRVHDGEDVRVALKDEE
jgi:non-ribosomal peptide synthetase component F